MSNVLVLFTYTRTLFCTSFQSNQQAKLLFIHKNVMYSCQTFTFSGPPWILFQAISEELMLWPLFAIHPWCFRDLKRFIILLRPLVHSMAICEFLLSFKSYTLKLWYPLLLTAKWKKKSMWNSWLFCFVYQLDFKERPTPITFLPTSLTKVLYKRFSRTKFLIPVQWCTPNT
jgi:hypothetical protein